MRKGFIAVITSLMMLGMVLTSVQANSESLVFEPSISDKILDYATELSYDQQAESGCRIGVTGKKNDSFTTSCITPDDAMLKNCTIRQNMLDIVTYTVLSEETHDITIQWKFLNDTSEKLVIRCTIVSLSPIGTEYVSWVKVIANGFAITKTNIPIVFDEDFFEEVYLPTVSR